MLFIAILLSSKEFIILTIVCIISVLAIYFFITSRKHLQRLLKTEERRIAFENAGNFSYEAEERLEKVQPPPKQNRVPQPFIYKKVRPAPAAVSGDEAYMPPIKGDRDVSRVMEDFYQAAPAKKNDEYEAQQEKIVELSIEADSLQRQLEQREKELQILKQQYTEAQKLSAKSEHVYHEYELLQEKVESLQLQLQKAGKLAIELNEAKEESLQIKKEAELNGQKLAAAIAEKNELQHQLMATEDKLQEIETQRKQLQKKVQLLESMNSEFQQVSEANKKLQSELRRLGELESMLSIISDERESLLQRRR